MVIEKTMDDLKNNEQNPDDMEARKELSEVETAGLMTDMKLDDSAEEFRNIEPDFPWTYFIEIYPWHAADMTEKFVKLIQIADFSRVVMRKKNNSNEQTDASDEKTKDAQPQHRQKMGCLQFYLLGRQSAKGVMRSISWKSMVAKELTVEITRRDPTDKEMPYETAYMELNTYPLCKCRFREKATGELKDRSTRVSKIPGEITRGFLEVVLTRAYPVVGDAADKSFAADPLKLLEDIEDFKGVLEFDCLTRGSARSFVQAHKRIVLNGQDLTVVAVDEKTMVEPTQPVADPNKAKKKDAKTSLLGSQVDAKSMRGRGRGGWQGARGSLARGSIARGGVGRGAIGRGRQDFSSNPGFARPIQPLMRPFTAPVPRNGPGMPLVPMTGRQKMNEKLRTGMRGAGPGSIGDTFKAEIAHLQNQLTESTMALNEKIALLQGHDNYPDMNDGYNDRSSSYNDRAIGYNNRSIGYNDRSIGYNDRSSGYNDRSSGYNDQATGYNDRSSGYSDMTSGYDSWSSRGWSNTDYGYDSGYSKSSYAQHTSRMGESRGSGVRGGTRASKRGRW